MTAGQGGGWHGGSEGGPEGAPGPAKPPYGQPPHGQPPQAQPPQGWYPPPGPSPYGYGPAPSAPTGWGAPTPVERPLTVRAGLGAYVAWTILGTVGLLVLVLDWDTYMGQALAQTGPPLTAEEERVAGAVTDALAVAIVVFAVVMTALQALFIWFAWRGRNWARIVLWVFGGLGLLFGIPGLALGSPLPFLTALSAFQLLFLLAGVVLTALRPSTEWYRYRSWLRATGQHG